MAAIFHAGFVAREQKRGELLRTHGDAEQIVLHDALGHHLAHRIEARGRARRPADCPSPAAPQNLPSPGRRQSARVRSASRIAARSSDFRMSPITICMPALVPEFAALRQIRSTGLEQFKSAAYCLVMREDYGCWRAACASWSVRSAMKKTRKIWIGVGAFILAGGGATSLPVAAQDGPSVESSIADAGPGCRRLCRAIGRSSDLAQAHDRWRRRRGR